MALIKKARWLIKSRRILTAAMFLLSALCVLQLLRNILSTSAYEPHLEGWHLEYLKLGQSICGFQGLGDESLTRKETREPPNILREPPNILILGSFGRTGSSFLGGLLSSLPGVFYYYEPLYYLEQWRMLTRTLAVQSLKDLFSCKFRGSVFTAMKNRGKRSFRHPYFRTCGTKRSCFELARLTRVCSREPVRMVKTIRTRVSWVEPLLEDPELNLRVIHIVRDPRGAIISNWKVGWGVDPGKICSDLLEDLERGRHLKQFHPNRYFSVRYEDLCADPRGIATSVLRFLGHSNLHPSTIRFLDEMTLKEDDDDDVYSLRRNSTHQHQKWRMVITEDDLTKVEAACPEAIKDLGVNLFRSIQNTRNLTFPLFNESISSPLFTYQNCINL